MTFLIQYDRSQGRIVELRTFDEDDRASAERERFRLELDVRRNANQLEVVLLEAASEEALRRTHRRYFETLEELTNPAPAGR